MLKVALSNCNFYFIYLSIYLFIYLFSYSTCIYIYFISLLMKYSQLDLLSKQSYSPPA